MKVMRAKRVMMGGKEQNDNDEGELGDKGDDEQR